METPIAKTQATVIREEILLTPILRAGLAFLPTFLQYFEDAKVAFIGLKRDEKTAKAEEHYRNIPEVKAQSTAIILDPMLATGGSASQAISILQESGFQEENIILSICIAAPEGIEKIEKDFPKIKLLFVIKDEKLTQDKFIFPGLGDYGDRYFKSN